MTPEEMEEMFENGRRLFQSAENLRNSAADLDALMGSVWEILSEAEFAGGRVEDANEDESFGNDWITPIYTGNARILCGGRGRRRLGTITYVVRLCGTGAWAADCPNWPWLDQACLFVGWHRRDEYWGPEDFEPAEAPNLHHRGDGLWAYRGQEENEDNGYFFAVPIFALRTEENLNQYVLAPLQALFAADPPTDIAKTALQGVPVLLPSS